MSKQDIYLNRNEMYFIDLMISSFELYIDCITAHTISDVNPLVDKASLSRKHIMGARAFAVNLF